MAVAGYLAKLAQRGVDATLQARRWKIGVPILHTGCKADTRQPVAHSGIRARLDPPPPRQTSVAVIRRPAAGDSRRAVAKSRRGRLAVPKVAGCGRTVMGGGDSAARTDARRTVGQATEVSVKPCCRAFRRPAVPTACACGEFRTRAILFFDPSKEK